MADKVNKKENIYLSIIVPFKNQANVLENTIKDLIEFTGNVDYETEVIFADTHSNDGTLDLAKKYAEQIEHFRIVEPKDARGGKGQGIHDGIIEALGKNILFMDADSSTKIFEVDKLLPYLKDYDIVMGSRYIQEPRPHKSQYIRSMLHSIKSVLEVIVLGYSKDNTTKEKQPRIRQLISRGGNLMFLMLLNQDYVDQRCGFKLYRRKAAKLLAELQTIYGNAGKDHGFGFDTEYIAIAQKYKLKSIEVPVVWYDSAKTAIVHPLRDTFMSFKDIFKIQLNLIKGRYSKKHLEKKLGQNIEEIVLNWD